LIGNILEKGEKNLRPITWQRKKIGPNRNLGEVDNEKIFP
jgi:hypothetical protein